MKRHLLLTLLLLVAVFLSSCGLMQEPAPTPTPFDQSAYATSIVQTVVAGITQTALVWTETPTPTETLTPLPSETPTITPTVYETPTEGSCDNLGFDGATLDVTIPDFTIIAPNTEFVKTWHVKNTGGCTWVAGTYQLVYGYGDQMGGKTVKLTVDVLPGAEVDISITLLSPKEPNTYSGYWRMSNGQYAFGEFISVIITVPRP